MMKSIKSILLLLCTVLSLTGCTGSSDETNEVQSQAAWQRYDAAREAKDLQRTLAVIDSMEQADIIGAARANHMRAFAYDQGWQMRIAEHYYKKAYEGYGAEPSQDWYLYGDAGYRWACMRLLRGDTDGALSVTSDLLAQVEENDSFPKRVETSLLMLMAEAQMQLHQNDEARLTWQKAYEAQQQVGAKTQQPSLPYVSMNISTGLFEMGDLEGAQEWLERCAQEFTVFEQTARDSLLKEEWRGHIALKRARYLQASGHTAEAAATYAAVPRSRIFEPHGYTEAAEYLMAAGRYKEAAYWYDQLDSTYLATDGARMTFDNIATRLSPRYLAYRKAGRNGDALAIADSISASIDSALVWQKKNDAAELAVIYQTHERDLQISNFKYQLKFHRLIAVGLAIILLLIAYLLYRAYIYNKVLAAKNRHLYEQIQEREKVEEEERQILQAKPDEVLTLEQQLYRRLCTLMAEQQPYTDENLNRDKLAQMLGTNAKYVVTAIRECSRGETVGDFITRYRLEHVARLLKTTDEPIAIIGELSGIPSRATLARLFRNTYGMTCSEFRQAAKRNDDIVHEKQKEEE